jgi:GDPmannose 4,6-dehydratase
MNIEWRNEGLNEIGIDRNTGQLRIVVDEKYFRPAEVETLLGDSSKAHKELGWKPKTTFDQLVEDMCKNET